VTQLLNDGRKLSGRLGKARPEDIYTALFESLASKLDPYSRYSGAGEARESRASRDGFGGIGVTIIPIRRASRSPTSLRGCRPRKPASIAANRSWRSTARRSPALTRRPRP
jgi:hypothetical protein